MVNVIKLHHVELRSPDVPRLIAHYTEVLDFIEVARGDDGAVFLSTEGAGHSLAVVPESNPGLGHLAFEVGGSLDASAKALSDSGFSAERRSDPNPSQSEILVVLDPEGNELQLAEAAPGGGPAKPVSAARPTKLGHVCYFVSDVQKTVDFYEQVMSFRWSDWMGDFFVFLRCGTEHHVINLLKSPQSRRLHHLAYEARDWNHIQLLCDRLATHEVPIVWGPGRHGPGHNIFTYHRDPDGNVVELFCELDIMLDEGLGYFEPRPWHKDHPQRPKVWEPGPLVPNSWGPMPPAEFLQ